MAGSTTSHIKSLREPSAPLAHEKETHLLKKNAEIEGKKANPFQLMQETLRYEKYCKYWSILSNVAAIVSVSSAIFGVMKKRRFW
jgi:hypothetical protein